MRVVKNNSLLQQRLGQFYRNILFLILPMLYIFYIYGVLDTKTKPVTIGVLLFVSFVLYVGLHISTYKFFREDNFAEKLRSQVIITNLSLEIVVFAICMGKTAGNAFGWIGLIIAVTLWIVLSILLMKLQINDYRHSKEKAFSGRAFYESLIILLLVIFIIFLFCQIYIFWSTWYIWIPVVTGSMMLATIYRNGIVYEESESPLNLFLVIPYLWAVGLISLICQFFFTPVIGSIVLWKMLLFVLLGLGIIFLYILSMRDVTKNRLRQEKLGV
jgi:hypothetical protein